MSGTEPTTFVFQVKCINHWTMTPLQIFPSPFKYKVTVLADKKETLIRVDNMENKVPCTAQSDADTHPQPKIQINTSCNSIRACQYTLCPIR